MPEISVIVPVYNVEKYVGECLDSILNQTFQDFEIICVNDGSTDASLKVLKKYAAKDSRIRVINQKNQGLSMARNNGVDAARGTYVYFLDSDDFIHPQLLEIAHHEIQREKGIKLVCFDIFRDDGHAPFTLQGCPTFDVNRLDTVVTHNPILFFKKGIRHRIYNSACLKMFHKDIFKELRFEPGLYFEDMLLTSLLMKRRPKTVIIPEKLYYYRTNEEGITNSKFTKKHMRSYQIGLIKIRDAYDEPALSSEYNMIRRNVFPDALAEIARRVSLCSEAEKKEIVPMWKELLSSLKHQRVISSCKKKIISVIKKKSTFAKHLTAPVLLRNGGNERMA